MLYLHCSHIKVVENSNSKVIKNTSRKKIRKSRKAKKINVAVRKLPH